MTAQVTKFDFYGDTLEVYYNGSMWVSPCNGQQHAQIADAVQAECAAYLRACGDDPSEYQGAIDNAIADAMES